MLGYAAVFYRADDPGTEYLLWDGTHERIRPEAFNRSLAEKEDVRAVLNHDSSILLGRTASGTLELWVDDVGLGYDVKIDTQDPDHQRVMAKLQRGDLTGSSFAFGIHDGGQEYVSEGKTRARYLRDLKLFDVGPVTYPAYKSTQASVRSDCDYSMTAARLPGLDMKGHAEVTEQGKESPIRELLRYQERLDRVLMRYGVGSLYSNKR